MHFGSFKCNQSHQNLEIVGDAACDHVNSLSQPSCAIKDKREMLPHQFLYDVLGLALFNQRNESHLQMICASQRVAFALEQMAKHVDLCRRYASIHHTLHHTPTIHVSICRQRSTLHMVLLEEARDQTTYGIVNLQCLHVLLKLQLVLF